MGKKAALLLLMLFAAASAEAAYYFYGEGCSHCAKVKPHIEQMAADGYEIEIFEVYGNRTNSLMLNRYFESYGVPMNHRGVPVVFYGDKYYIGGTPIIEGLKSIIADENESCAPPVQQVGDSSSLKPEEVSIWLLTGAALVDSINPCAIAVLLILLTALMAAGDRKRALKAGLAFICSIYLAYLLFGFGLFSAIQFTGVSYIFYQFVGLLALIVGLANIKDFIWYGAGGFAMEIPKSWRPTMKRILEKATSPLGAFIAGFAVCLFELPCTGGPYLFVLGLLAEKTTQMTAIPLLMYYNVVFVLPLLVITLLFYFGQSKIEQMQDWKDRNLRNLHLVAGLIMCAMGIAVIMGLA